MSLQSKKSNCRVANMSTKNLKNSLDPDVLLLVCYWAVSGFPGGSAVKTLPATAGDTASISESGRSPRGGNGNLPQYSCLKNPMDRGACQVIQSTRSQESETT